MKDKLKSLPKFECTGCGLQKKGFDPVKEKILGPGEDRRVYILAHASARLDRRYPGSSLQAKQAYGFTIGMTACEAMDAELCVRSQNYTACQGLCFLSDDPSNYKRHDGILRVDGHDWETLTLRLTQFGHSDIGYRGRNLSGGGR